MRRSPVIDNVNQQRGGNTPITNPQTPELNPIIDVDINFSLLNLNNNQEELLEVKEELPKIIPLNNLKPKSNIKILDFTKSINTNSKHK